MNVYDSKRMADVLAPLGFEPTDSAETADMIILNTCHIREKAAEKLYSELGRYKLSQDQRRAQGSDTLIAVAGCVAQAEGVEIMRRAPYVDIVLGPQTYHRLPNMIRMATNVVRKDDIIGAGIIDTDFPVETKFDHLPTHTRSSPSAFLSIQEGCDKFCSFCVVPYTRGTEESRPVEKILTIVFNTSDNPIVTTLVVNSTHLFICHLKKIRTIRMNNCISINRKYLVILNIISI